MCLKVDDGDKVRGADGGTQRSYEQRPPDVAAGRRHRSAAWCRPAVLQRLQTHTINDNLYRPCIYKRALSICLSVCLYACQSCRNGGTGIRGLTRGAATIPQGNQQLLVVRDKVGRPPGELGVSKSMECDIFPSLL